jgi:hypothetical protein
MAATERLREAARHELAVRLPEHLGRLGWDRARIEIAIRVVPSIGRHAESGKVLRFIPA